jgi:ferredoxin-NADP reductase
VTYVVGDHSSPEGRNLLSPEHLRELVPDLAERDVYLCGPPAMTEVTEQRLRHAGVPRRRLHVERFAL